MSFVRSGPRMLIVEAKDENVFRSFLKAHFEPLMFNDQIKNFEDVISIMNQHQTLIYLADNAKAPIAKFKIENCVVINASAQTFLIEALNCSASTMITFIRRAPRMIIMKVIGNIENTLTNIADDFKAEIESTSTIFNTHTNGTVILFTKANISKRLEFSDLYTKAIYTEDHFSEIINTLDHHALKYINRNSDNKDWYNLTININDKYEDFKTHYNRLIYVLDRLGTGMILKEGYSEDNGFFSSTEVYKITLYTYMEPVEIKKILFALEYLENGERIVDFDLYHKKKKIHVDDIRIRGIDSLDDLSMHYRQQLYKSLESDDIEYIRSIEDYIFASR